MQGSIATEQNASILLHGGLIALVSWIATPIALFILGRLLGNFTLAIARRSITGPNGLAVLIGLLARLLYRVVIALSILYFYVALPVLILAVFAIIYGELYYMELGESRIFLWVLFGFVIASFLPVIVATIIGGSRRKERIRFLTREEAPLFWNVVEEVAQSVNTRPVDSIRITPRAGISVREERGRFLRLQPAERQLEVGFGALAGMTQGQFKAILAHEYGHFSNRDTAGGNWAWQLQVSIGETMVALEESAAESHYFLWFLFLFFIRFLVYTYYRRIFLPITIGATRLQEMMADRYAALAYGGNNFAAGLTHVIHQGLIFKAQSDVEVRAARQAKRKIHNLYTLPPLDATTGQQINALFEKIMRQKTSVYDTHPAPYERIQLIQSLNPSTVTETNNEPVWNLLADAESLQMEMTGVIQSVLYSRHGHAWAR